jgi:chromate reductase
MRILAVSGSLRRGSHNTALLRLAAGVAPAAVEIELFEELATLPPFSEDDEDLEPEAVGRWRDAIDRADALLIATPEYNGSIPGQLKNAVDWASRPLDTSPLRGKPVAVVGASTSAYGALWAQAELRKSLGTAGARVVDGKLAIPHAHELRADGEELRLTGVQRRRLTGILESLVEAARALAAVA